MSKRSPHNHNKSPSPALSRSPCSSKAGSSSNLSEDTRLRESLFADLEAIFSDDSTSDLEFVVEHERIKAHRLIVLARCDKFKSKRRAWMGSQQPDTITVDLGKPCTVDGVRAVVKYLYTGKISFQCIDPFQVLHLCSELGLPLLQSYTLHHIASSLTSESVSRTLLTCESLLESCEDDMLKVALQRVHLDCITFIQTHTRTVFLSDSFLLLPKDTLISIISDNKLSISEEDVWRVVVRWGQRYAGIKQTNMPWSATDQSKIQEALQGVLEHVRIMEINSEVFAKEVEPTGLLPMEMTLARYRQAAMRKKGTIVEQSRPRSGIQEPFIDSAILAGRADLQMQINEWCDSPAQEWVILYRGSRDGFQARTFHSCCDERGPTVVLVRTASGCMFGGYADVSWSSRFKRGKFSSSPNCFLFTLVNPFDTPPTRFDVVHPPYAINNHPGNGPIFGSGADLCLSTECNRSKDSYSLLANSYGEPGTQPNLLAGEQYFSVEDYEVFGLAT